jgi:hypothetical protein
VGGEKVVSRSACNNTTVPDDILIAASPPIKKFTEDTTDTTSTNLNLPRELRNWIYRLYFEDF